MPVSVRVTSMQKLQRRGGKRQKRWASGGGAGENSLAGGCSRLAEPVSQLHSRAGGAADDDDLVGRRRSRQLVGQRGSGEALQVGGRVGSALGRGGRPGAAAGGRQDCQQALHLALEPPDLCVLGGRSGVMTREESRNLGEAQLVLQLRSVGRREGMGRQGGAAVGGLMGLPLGSQPGANACSGTKPRTNEARKKSLKSTKRALSPA